MTRRLNLEAKAKADEAGWKGNEFGTVNADIIVFSQPEIALIT